MISTREYQILTSASPRSILVFSGRYHIISNASLVNNCIIFLCFTLRRFFSVPTAYALVENKKIYFLITHSYLEAW